MQNGTKKQRWIRRYTPRIVSAIRRWQGPLGVAPEYAEHVQQQLDEFYDDPLKRKLIEQSF